MESIPVSRSPESFEDFYRREYGPVLGLAITLSGSRSVAEEITHDAFLATMSKWDRVGQFDSPGAWVRRIVANRSVSAFRRLRVETRAIARLESRGVSDFPGDLVEALDVWSGVRRLPRRQAQAIALTYLHGLGRREVAVVLRCGEETVKTHLERAKRTLAERLHR